MGITNKKSNPIKTNALVFYWPSPNFARKGVGPTIRLNTIKKKKTYDFNNLIVGPTPFLMELREGP